MKKPGNAKTPHTLLNIKIIGKIYDTASEGRQ